MRFTRRKLITRSGQLVAATALASPLVASERIAAVLAAAAPTPPPELISAPLSEADYWAFADRIATYFDDRWRQKNSRYDQLGTQLNSHLLATHSIAALTGHNGLSRQDERARLLAARLCESPPWIETPSTDAFSSQHYAPAWTESLAQTDARQHTSIDPKVAEALAYAWKARDIIGLPSETASLIQDRIDRCARGRFFRYPSVRLNQINWPCELYAHAATVADDKPLLTDSYRLHVRRFIAGIKRPLKPGGSPNLGGSYRLHYLPHKPPDDQINLDSPEYANIILDFLVHYEEALAAGMQPLSGSEIRLLKAWVARALCGYWTHGGYLNWDTGLGFNRWHLGKYWAWAQQGLLAIAASPLFQPSHEFGEWAKYLFDRGLLLYQRLAREEGHSTGLVIPLLYDTHRHYQGSAQRELFAARIQANAARAVVLGLGKMKGTQPPPLYAFDADIGRLAVTTPAYSTAVLAVNQGAVPYGGIELARLYDGDQRLCSNIGGRRPAAFGMVVKNGGGQVVLVSQQGKKEPDAEHAPIELKKPPGQWIKRLIPYLHHPPAGPFQKIVAIGRRESGSLKLITTHTFRAESIETRWQLRNGDGQSAYTADLLFPCTGFKAQITAVFESGEQLVLAGPGQLARNVKVGDVSFFHIAGEDGGYTVKPLMRPAGAIARITRPKPRGYINKPGPTLQIRVAERNKFSQVSFAVRIAPAAGV